MTIKKLIFEFALEFVVTLVIVIIVTFLWNLIGYGTKTIDWETSFRFAILFGILLTWANHRRSRSEK